MESDTLSIISFSLMILSVLSLWITTQKASWVLFFLAIILGFVNDNIGFQGILYLIVLAIELIVYYSLSYERLAKPILGFAVALLGFLLINHYLPGFEKWRTHTKIILSGQSKSFTIYFFFDKIAIAFFILSLGLPLIRSRSDWAKMIKTAILYGVITFVVVAAIAMATGYAAFEPKIPSVTPLWLVYIIFFTCIPEEVFYRGFIQKQTAIFLRYSRNGYWIAILAGTIMFSLQNLKSGNWRYVLISAVSGILYGLLYKKTDRIEAPIIAHFIVNLGHFFLFTYPFIGSPRYSPV